MYQENQALYKVFAGTGKMNCMYLFYSATSSKVSTEIPTNATPSSLFSNVTAYGGILRVENIVRLTMERHTVKCSRTVCRCMRPHLLSAAAARKTI